MKSGDPALYWPKEWLPNDEALQDIRIHSFGYDSNWGKKSVLGIHDFADALLNSILDCPSIPRDTKVGPFPFGIRHSTSNGWKVFLVSSTRTTEEIDVSGRNKIS
jgi:hypothetical protein